MSWLWRRWKDISVLANYWKIFTRNLIYLSRCSRGVQKVNPDGFQWFDLTDQTEDEILSKSLIAEKKLNTLIDECIKENKINNNKIALVGFSQGDA